MDERRPAAEGRLPAWIAWAGGAALAGLTGTAFALWGLRGPAILLDLVMAYCF